MTTGRINQVTILTFFFPPPPEERERKKKKEPQKKPSKERKKKRDFSLFFLVSTRARPGVSPKPCSQNITRDVGTFWVAWERCLGYVSLGLRCFFTPSFFCFPGCQLPSTKEGKKGSVQHPHQDNAPNHDPPPFRGCSKPWTVDGKKKNAGLCCGPPEREPRKPGRF